MVFTINIDGEWDNEESPRYYVYHPLTLALFDTIPIVGKTFYQQDASEADSGHPTFLIKHDNPVLPEIRRELSKYLEGYEPQRGDAMSMDFLPLKYFEGDGVIQKAVIKGQDFEYEKSRTEGARESGKIVPSRLDELEEMMLPRLGEEGVTVRYHEVPYSEERSRMEGKIKYVAYVLNRIIEYSMERKKDIKVN